MTSKEVMLELLGFVAFQVPIEKQEEWNEMLHTLQNDLDELEKLKKAVEIVKKKKYAIKKYFSENNTWATMGLCLSTDFIRKDKNNDSNNIPPIDKLLTEEEANIIGEVFGVKIRALKEEKI